jgi:hypothetical protein
MDGTFENRRTQGGFHDFWMTIPVVSCWGLTRQANFQAGPPGEVSDAVRFLS